MNVLGAAANTSLEELLGQPCCPCALPVLMYQSGRHSLDFGPAFLHHKYL